MGKITVLGYTPKNPFEIMGAMAGECWGSDTTATDKNVKRGKSCVADGHGRVWELADVYLKIEGYSARVMREWYTHIGGSPTRLQASTRYINYSDLEVIVPPSIKANKALFERYMGCVDSIKTTYADMLELGASKEDIANLLPLGMTTVVVDKRNVRNLIEMSHQRLCSRAYWEYRQLMKDIMTALSEYSEQWKYIVDNYMMPKCEYMGYCQEHKSCGRKPQKEN